MKRYKERPKITSKQALEKYNAALQSDDKDQIVAAANILAKEYLSLVSMSLRMEECIHKLSKEAEELK